MGLQFKICYRKGSTNATADALSRKYSEDSSKLNAVYSCTPVWLQEVSDGYLSDPYSAQLLSDLALCPTARPLFSLCSGIIKYKGRVWLGNHLALQHKIIDALHSSPMGGHSGFPVTYRRIKALFAWPKMKQGIKDAIAGCSVCLQSKPDRSRYPGLLQPLPVLDGAWQVLTMDFIEGLPKSGRYNSILVVVDKFSKYSHFVPLCHPFTAFDVVQAFMSNIYKLHGLPQFIISDRDKIFTSQFWEQLFSRSGTKLHLSTSYHPQTDGQTKRVNQCLEIYLRSFVHAMPSKWSLWLYLAEFWFNTSYHSALLKSPFEVLYGYPPGHFGIREDACSISDLNTWLSERKMMTQLLQQHLNRAQQQMKSYADKKRNFREFAVGDWVYLKLQPYIQSSVARRANHKLCFKYFGPFQVLNRVGKVAYHLNLPDHSAIHPVFHVSQLKPAIGFKHAIQPRLPTLSLHQVPVSILESHQVKKGNSSSTQVLVQWSDAVAGEETWEDLVELKQRFPGALAWGQGQSQGEGIVSVPDLL